jgi:hypothetical protein
LTNERPSEELLKRLENLPPAEPRSKLEPLRAYILRWRQQGRSYRRIQQILREHCQMDVAYETLRRFVQRRETSRSAEPEPVAASVSAAPRDEAKPRWNFGADKPRTTAAVEEKRPSLSPEERAAQVEFIRSLNK